MQANSVMMNSRMRIDKEKFGKFIARRRETIVGVHTQVLLAEKLSVSKGTIAKIETGDRLPSFELFIDLADALLMTPGELMMVIAEREGPDKNYMEMNDWLYEQLARLMNEYHVKRFPEALPPHDLIPTTPEMLEELNTAKQKVSEQIAAREKTETPETVNHTPTQDDTVD